MKVLLSVLVFGACGVLFASAEANSAPQELLTWYSDTMVAYGDLVTALDKADDSTATAAAFQKATSAVLTKKLAVRYKELRSRYSEFFRNAESGNTNWTPPPEWLKAIADYGQAVQNYGLGMQKAMTYAQDPTVAKALEDFSDAMGAIDGE